jgi:hypothetical protein
VGVGGKERSGRHDRGGRVFLMLAISAAHSVSQWVEKVEINGLVSSAATTSLQSISFRSWEGRIASLTNVAIRPGS